MEFVGENLLPGIIGESSIIVAFLSIIATMVLYGIGVGNEEKSLKFNPIAKITYYVHSAAVFTTIGSLFFIINNHLFEYNYAYSHTSLSLPLIYQFSCFWEGQEGSVLLWLFWQTILGLLLIHTIKKYKNETMIAYGSIALFLVSMLLGLKIGDQNFGLSPFILLRETMPDAPLFTVANYLEQLGDGNGLNPLLQNYWMVIHPPTLFLGFAFMAPPFAYVIAALWRRDYKYFIEPVLKWTLIGSMVLGIGVLMGGAWAYEALSFGGFWAWDPVENASIFPWLLIVAALHTLVVYKHTGRSLKFTLLLYILALVMVVYSSFLTRSGILGETSVHSFADNGLMVQLIIFLGVITTGAFAFFFSRFKSLIEVKEEEKTNSREFWLFVGAVVFFLSWLQIFFSTSVPVINEVFKLNIAPPTNVIDYYNKWQLPFGIFMALLSGGALFFKYKKTEWSNVAKKLIPITVLAGVFTALINIEYPFGFSNNALLFASLFCVIGSAWMLIDFARKDFLKAGAAFTHFGFGVLLVGVVISNGQKETISINTQNIAYGKGYDLSENRLNTLIYKGGKNVVGPYLVSYDKDSFEYENHFYELKFQVMDLENKSLSEPFFLYPYVQDNPKFGKSANPDTKHYWNFDVFTHITSAYTPSLEKGEIKKKYIELGDTIYVNSGTIILRKIDAEPKHTLITENDIPVGALLEVQTKDTVLFVEPICLIRNNHWHTIPSKIENIGLELSFSHIDTENNKFEIGVLEENAGKDFIILKAMIFPFINLVWLGSILLSIGFMISFIHRVRLKLA